MEGFLQLLPVYLDHILYPTLTATGHHTEVHHINGEGEDAGVVYCEMQGRENSGPDRMHLTMHRLMYPDSGYRSETGGLMRCLRGLTVETIRKYHRDFYRPENLCLVICGSMSSGGHTERLIRAIEEFEKRKILPRQLDDTKSQPRPWVDSGAVQPLAESVDSIVEFPDEDESIGSVMLGWSGPKVSD